MFECPHVNGRVELTHEREEHIIARHPDLLPAHRACIAETLHKPDRVLPSARVRNALKFARWFPGVRGGRFAVIVVVVDAGPQPRQWIVTAYLTKHLAEKEQ